MKRVQRKFYLKPVIAAVILLLVVSGCAVVEKLDSFNGIFDPPQPDFEISELKRAEGAFFAGNFVDAEELFLTLYESSSKSIYRNHALYGLACTRMMIAENAKKYENAIMLLQNWRLQDLHQSQFRENPRLLITALSQNISFFECEPEIKYVVSQKSEEVAKKQQNEIRKLRDTIVKLQHQISVLEAIDQETQEKRKPQ